MNPIRILVVDDEDIVRKTLVAFLVELGYQVNDVADGESALLEVESGSYDIALVDVNMPGMDGITLISRIRKLDIHIPILLISGQGDSEISDRARTLNVNEYLTKPFNFSELDSIIDRQFVG